MNTPFNRLPVSAIWYQVVVLAFLVGFLVLMNVYYDDHAMDVSLIPRLRGLSAGLFAMVLFLLLPPVARCLDFSVLGSPLILCYGAFSALCFLSLVWALNPTAGFTDAFKTLGGFLTLCLLCLLLPTMRNWPHRLLQVAVCGALVSSCWGIYEVTSLFGLSFVHTRHEMYGVTGTMANVNLYAGFLALLWPLCLCAVALLRGWWRALGSFAMITTVLMILLLQTRAAYLGFAASLAVGMAGAIIFAPSLGLGHRLRTLVALAAAVLLGAFCLFYFFAPEGNPIALRLRSIANSAETASGGARFAAWQITLQMAKDHFPWGVGTGNFTVRLDEYFNARTDFTGAGTNWIYPHNDFLWVLAELGLLGIAAFIGVFLYAFGSCLTVLRRRGSTVTDTWMALAVIMAMAAYLVDASFGFPLARISHQIYLATLFAVSVLLARGDKCAPGLSARYPRWLLAGALPALAVLLLGFSYARAAIKQEFYLSVVFALESEKMWPAALRVLRAAESPWKTTDPFATPWAYHEARVLQKMGADDEEVLAALEKAYTQNPNRLHVINDLGAFYGKTGRIEKAIELFTKTARRYPNQIVAIENLAQCYIDQDDYASALKILEEIPEDKRTEAVRTKIVGCRQALEKQ